MPRIIAGKARGLKLKTLKGSHTRPSSDRLKEALFSMLQDRIRDSHFLDAFAGSGQIGLEALSRGAQSCTFIENNRQALKIVRENIALAKFPHEQVQVLEGDIVRNFRTLAERGESFDLIYVDPPWAEAGRILAQLSDLWSPLVQDHTRIILELEKGQEDLISQVPFDLLRTCHYGQAMLLFYNN